ncbi:MAG: hypothetical protein ACPGSI_17765 [Pikeienuella sp.]
MTVTGEQYAIAALCEAVANNVSNQIVWCALFNSTDGKALDANIQAAIHAGEWLDALAEPIDG